MANHGHPQMENGWTPAIAAYVMHSLLGGRSPLDCAGVTPAQDPTES